MTLIATVRGAWGWCGIEPTEIVRENAFGNLIVGDASGRYWRICPEECSCEVVAENRQQLDTLSTDQSFLTDWHMANLVALGEAKFGSLPPGRKFCLKMPAVLGGGYAVENLGTVSLDELFRSPETLRAKSRIYRMGRLFAWTYRDGAV